VAVSGTVQMLWLTFAPITTEAATHYGVSVDAIGWLSELFPLLYVLLRFRPAQLLAGCALDRRLRPAPGTGVALDAVGAMVRVASPSYAGVLIGQFLIAVAQPLVLAAVTRVVEASVPADRRPQAIGLASAGLLAGMLVALVMRPLLGTDHLTALLVVQPGITVLAAAALGVAGESPPGVL
jgi:predicted MFS family arabinose efflux permease